MSDICFDKVSKAFGNKQVLCDLTLCIKEHTVFNIMGSSGKGKTTLLNLILGIIKPDSGSISGVPERISAVFQEDRLFEDFSALSNVKSASTAPDRAETAKKHLIALGLGDNLRTPVRELSGGMKRRVCIARALASDATLLILDEAFKGLDEDTKKDVIAYVKEQTRDKTVISVTHDPAEAEALGGITFILP